VANKTNRNKHVGHYIGGFDLFDAASHEENKNPP
jgi:hypothetical protein